MTRTTLQFLVIFDNSYNISLFYIMLLFSINILALVTITRLVLIDETNNESVFNNTFTNFSVRFSIFYTKVLG